MKTEIRFLTVSGKGLVNTGWGKGRFIVVGTKTPFIL